jgi:phosphate-selective porin OprO/OprP
MVLGLGARAGAQEPANDDLKARIERLERQNQELLEALKRLQATPTSPVTGFREVPGLTVGGGAAEAGGGLGKEDVQKIVGDYLKQKEAEKKKADDAAKKKLEDEGFRVGSDLSMKATWKDGVVITTPQDDFSLHVGGWIQWDNVWWSQTPALRAAPGARAGPKQGVGSGPALGGIGDLQDGEYFRRERIMLDGKFWENYEYTLVFALENDQFLTSGLDEFWVGATNIPLIGTARFGHVKNCIGLEADMASSSRTMTFLERSSYSEAIEMNQNFVTGAWLGNNYFDQRATWSGVIFRPDPGSSTGAFFGDGQWAWQGRLTALPLWDCEGRHYMHVGLSGGWRSGVNNLANSPLRTIQVRARPEQRDDVPAGGFTNADSNRMVDTGLLAADHQWLMGLELFYVKGPFSFQAEYGWNWVDNVIGAGPSGFTLNPKFVPAGNYVFNGGYAQIAYTLTGESRSYDKRLGRLDSYYFGRRGPFTNAWFVRDENGALDFGIGAWEIAARYSYVDLNDGSGLTQIRGGRMDGLSFALNWYLNTNLKVQFEYVYDHRFDVPPGVIPGYTSGFGTRIQFMY